MKYPLLFHAVLALTGLRLAASAHVPFEPTLAPGTRIVIDARALHPTQFSHGWREVLHKQEKFDAMPAAAAKAYLIDKDVPVVIGPGGVAYMTDGHHTLRALLESSQPDKTAYGHVLANWSDLAPDAFWERMRASNYAYLRDAQGRDRPPSDLPASLLVMQRDPWRGLAWAVMEANAFRERKGVFFQEFRWADFFRSRITWDDTDEEAFEEAVVAACVLAQTPAAAGLPGYRDGVVQPRVITERAKHDTDDPAIWINAANPAGSLVLGTDKDTDGALLAFDLSGRIVRSVPGLRRPNNVDIAPGFRLGGRTVDLAIVTERESHRLRAFTLPDLAPADRGDLIVFDRDAARAPMGVAVYRRPRDGAVFVIVGGKSGPAEGYLAQYRLEDGADGNVRLAFVRNFGRYSGRAEIEAIAVDAEAGHVYYADETFGVRKYPADPDAPDANRELAHFATTDFASDHEGISIYTQSGGAGWILVSEQQAHRFQIFARQGPAASPSAHPRVGLVEVAAIESDGSEVTSTPLPGFPGGLFVAMSTDRTFHFYAWDDLAAAAGLK